MPPICAPLPDNFTTCSQEDLLREIAACRQESGTPTFFFGTGLTSALSKGHRTASWSGLMQHVLEHWAPHMHDKPAGSIAPPWVLSHSPDGDCLIAAAYVLRRQMMADRGGRGAVSFEKAVRLAVEEMCVKADQISKKTPLRTTLEKLGECVVQGAARVLTVNYDDLVARIAGLKVLLPDGRYFEPGPQSGKAAQPFDPPYGVPETLRRMPAWTAIGNSAANPEHIAAVLHLHGWHGEDESVVIDPITYHKISQLPEGLLRQSAGIRNVELCNMAVAEAMRAGPMIYYGMGEGMFDQHLEMLRTLAQDDSLKEPPLQRFRAKLCQQLATRAQMPHAVHDLSQTNFWILRKEVFEKDGRAWFKKNREAGRALRVVTVKDFSEMERLLRSIVEQIQGSVHRNNIH